MCASGLKAGAEIEEVIRAGGGEVIGKPARFMSSELIAELIIDFNHWVGTAQMGTNAKTSVVNTPSQCHDISNLFIGAASVFPAYPEKKPTLTNIALSWRMSERLVEKFKRNEL